MPTVRVTERFAFRRGGNIRRDGPYPVIEKVLICGFDSANERGYKPAAWAGDRVKRYEGIASYANHANGSRAVETKLGWFENVFVRDDGKPVGDYCLNPKHPLAESVLWAAEHKPDFYGMSHVAHCKTSRGADGREMVEEVVSVESVDLVADPATTNSLFESKGTAVKIKLPKLVEWLAPKVTFDKLARVKRLSEMDGMGDMDVADPAAPDAATDPDDAIDGAFKQAMHAVIDGYPDQLDAAGVLGKLKELFKAHGKLGDSGDTGEAEGEGDSGEGDTKESKAAGKAKPDPIREAIEVCRKVGFKGFDADDLDLIGSAPAERREAVAKRLMGTAQQPATGEKPKSAGRHGAARLDESADAGAAEKPPTDAKKFAEWASN